MVAFVAVVVSGVVAFVFSAVGVSASLIFLFGTSLSPLDSDSDRFCAADESSVDGVAASVAKNEIYFCFSNYK